MTKKKNKIPTIYLIIPPIGFLAAMGMIINGIIKGEIEISMVEIFPFIYIIFIMFFVILTFFFLRKLKGSLRIELKKDVYTPGDNLSGVIKIKANKDISVSKLEIRWMLEKEEYEKINYVNVVHEDGSGQVITRPLDKAKNGPAYWESWWKTKKRLDVPETIKKREELYLDFSIKIPALEELAKSKKDKEWLEQIKNEEGEERIRGRLEVQLFVKGIDFWQEKIVNIKY